MDVRALVEEYGRGLPAERKPEYFSLHRSRYVALLEALAVPAGSRILEIGCNPGHFTELMVRAGFRVDGIDLHPEHRAELWRALGVEVRRCNLEFDPLPYGDGLFDAVVFAEVMEHLPGSPLPALEEIRRVLVPGGLLVLSTPNARSLRTRLLLAARLLAWMSLDTRTEFRRRMLLRGEDRYTVHYRLYTAEEVRWLLREAGFVRPSVRYVAARESVGLSSARLLRSLPKVGMWTIAQMVPFVRSMLLVTARRPTDEREGGSAR
ncbi:MAG: class I SAM-dependent methyltransferase [Chloroflexia bacterium]